MVILVWKVKCDNCGAIINAKKEHYAQGDYEQFCNKCASEDSPR